ncbi:FtsX-like permease family protein [Streptomyces sp. SID8379]|uniref:FtsX-like permease family protein n=1 Tax=unclassified Streptomyces TaxID=2593676 RepID=UPI0007C5A5DC|nr:MULTISPECIES: FtsX-like permease family protein [unclassified Streptomyces]MYW69580.1 FtsX-like permease family protein [Streptomyces sp. SID8379]
MSTVLAHAALRAHRPAFVGTAVAALFAATVVSASTMVLTSTNTHAVSPSARHRITTNGVGDIAAVLLIGSIYMSIFVVVATMGTAVAQQHRELALVRAIGARPRQVRRAVVLQALAASVPAALLGFVLGGTVLAPMWFHGMVTHGLVPASVPYRFSWLALPVCLAVATVTSALAALLASLRFSVLRPAHALAEAAAGRRRLGALRAPLGAVAIAAAAFLSVLLSRQSPQEANAGAFLVLLLFCAGVGLLGPRLIGPAARLVSALLGRCGPSARLAMRNVRSEPRRFGAAVIPLVLVVGFGLTKIALRTTAAHVTGSAGSRGEIWLDYLGTSLYVGFAAIASANTLAMISLERRRDLALLRVVGSQRGQIRAMACWEALVVAGTALLLGTIIALATLAPILSTTFGSPLPYVPWAVAAAIALGTVVLTVTSTGVPVQAGLRGRPIDVVRT